jgi:predicted lipoprotein with Yx(FWY)xxD motif
VGNLFRVRRLALTLAVTILALAGVAAIAVAAATTLGTGTAKVSGKNKTVVVDSKGVTLYTLSGESVGRRTTLKCQTKACFAIWPPYKTSASGSLTKARGIKGTLGRVRRVKGGFSQVTLDGHPLYTFSGDRSKRGSAVGEGIKSFGGTWHVVNP